MKLIKKFPYLLPVILFAAMFCSLAFAPGPQNKKTLANVKQDNGLYVFIESTPVSDYETLGNVKKTGLVMNGKAEEMVKIITRRAKDDYPTCDAVIFDDLKLDHATVIKFK